MDSSYQQLTDSQEMVLSILPFPGACLSILGSSAIIYITREQRKVKRWTPYNRLLVAMSANDILLSLCFGIAPFLRPKHTSHIMWAFGNDATCSFVGFVMQTTSAGYWYQGMLSIYFLLTARYGMKNETIAKRIEPFMHLLALGYSIGTAVAGAAMNVYGVRADGPACWVSDYTGPRETDDLGIRVKAKDRNILTYIFYVIPMIVTLLCLVFAQLSIYLFVRGHTRRLASAQDITLSTTPYKSDEASLVWSDQSLSVMESAELERAKSTTCQNTNLSPKHTETNKITTSTLSLKSQSQRLQLVCSQAFLFVMAFVICNAFNLIVLALQSGVRNEAAEMEMLVKYYSVIVLQAIVLPAQGFFNLLIYVRPKYMVLRQKFPNEERLRTVKRVFQSNQLRTTNYKLQANMEVTTNQQYAAGENDVDEPVGDTKSRGARKMMSSITISDGDFDSILENGLINDDRWHDVSSEANQRTPADLANSVNRLTTLEAISELSASVFELTPYQINGSHLSVASDGLSIPTNPSESRWKGEETPTTTLGSSSAGGNERELGGVQKRALSADSKSEAARLSPSSTDLPIRVPRRTTD